MTNWRHDLDMNAVKDEADTIGVVIGRFQIDNLHTSHIELLKYAEQRHPRLIVFLGVRNSPPTATNPLPFDVRAHMVQGYVPNAIILPLDDCTSNEEWSQQIDNLIRATFGYGKASIYIGPNSNVKECYVGRHSVVYYTVTQAKDSATSVRKYIAEHPEYQSGDFRRGIIYAMQHLPHRTYHTVDICMYKEVDKRTDILLAKKPFQSQLRFVGGFVEPNESFEMAARRELREETGMLAEGKMEYLGDFIIDDWRVKGQKGVNHRTVLFAAQYTHGLPKANDDISEIGWYPVNGLGEDSIVPEHKALFKAVQNRFLSYLRDINETY